VRSLALLFVAACARPAPLAPEPPPPPDCSNDVQNTPSLGERGRIGFGFFPAVSQQLETPLAAGGAHTELLALSPASTPPVRSVTSTAPEVVSFVLSSVGGSLCQNQALLLLHTGRPGSAALRLFDDGGAEIDRVTLTVEATTELPLDRAFGDAAPARILAGSLQGVHTTTLGAKGILVGTGSVEFHLEGDLLPYPVRDAAPPWWGGDALAFTGRPGQGRVVADCGGAHAEVPVQVLDPSALGEVTLQAPAAKWPATVDVTVVAQAQSDGALIYGAQCRWAWPFGRPEWIDGGWIGDDPVARYRFTAPRAGTFNATCVLPGERRETVTLTFE
jgi:hypothetical protein